MQLTPRISFASFAAIVAAAGLLGSGCGKGKSSGGAKANAADPGAAAAAQVVSNKLAVIAAAGDPITVEDLNKWYPEPPVGQNAADLYGQAFAALAPSRSSDEEKSPAFLARNQQALGLLLQAAERKSCRYPVNLEDGAAAKLSHLAKVKSCAYLLEGEAVVQASRGRTDAATKALLAGIALARSLQNEPLLVSWLLQNACLAITFQGLEEALSRKAFTEDQLLSLQAALRDAESWASFGRGVRGERASFISNCLMSSEAWSNAWSQAAGTNLSQVTELVAYRKTATFQQDFDFALDYYSNLLALADMPFPQCLDAQAQGAGLNRETARARNFLVSSMLLPDLGILPSKAGNVAARVRITRAALALERYRLKHANALPGALADLTPELLEAVPSDPFDGQPLRYNKFPGKGYVIYSIGGDRKDNNGAAKSADGKGLDISLTVQR
jgi:hypothetical protein